MLDYCKYPRKTVKNFMILCFKVISLVSIISLEIWYGYNLFILHYKLPQQSCLDQVQYNDLITYY